MVRSFLNEEVMRNFDVENKAARCLVSFQLGLEILITPFYPCILLSFGLWVHRNTYLLIAFLVIDQGQMPLSIIEIVRGDISAEFFKRSSFLNIKLWQRITIGEDALVDMFDIIVVEFHFSDANLRCNLSACSHCSAKW